MTFGAVNISDSFIDFHSMKALYLLLKHHSDYSISESIRARSNLAAAKDANDAYKKEQDDSGATVGSFLTYMPYSDQVIANMEQIVSREEKESQMKTALLNKFVDKFIGDY